MSNSNINDQIHTFVDQYLDSFGGEEKLGEALSFDHPDKEKIRELLNAIQKIIFPGYFRTKSHQIYDVKTHMGMRVEDAVCLLTGQIALVLHFCPEYENIDQKKANEISEELVLKFLKKFPEIRELCETDVEATLDGDPAAFNKSEIILAYPGLYTIMVYRIAHELYELNIPVIPRLMTEYAHSVTGIDINPGAKIGRSFFIDHGDRRKCQGLSGSDIGSAFHKGRQKITQ